MEGSQRMTLREPVRATRSESGAPGAIEYRDHEVWVTRLDRGGGLRNEDERLLEEVDAVFRFRKYPSIAGLGTAWRLVDWDGRIFKIESVALAGTEREDQLRINRFVVAANLSKSAREGVTIAGPSEPLTPSERRPRAFSAAFSSAFG